MATFRIDLLDVGNPALVEASVELLVSAFTNSERYGAKRLREELRANSGLFYRRFFVATEARDIIGVGGVTAADWASHTHLLYLSAVAQEQRGQGIGQALVKARVKWVEQNFKAGRILVSSTKGKRFRDLGFVEVRKSAIEGRHLMMLRF